MYCTKTLLVLQRGQFDSTVPVQMVKKSLTLTFDLLTSGSVHAEVLSEFGISSSSHFVELRQTKKQMKLKTFCWRLDSWRVIMLAMTVYKCLHRSASTFLADDCLAISAIVGKRHTALRWHWFTVCTKEGDHAGDEEFCDRRFSHLQPQPSPPRRSLDASRPTCSADR